MTLVTNLLLLSSSLQGLAQASPSPKAKRQDESSGSTNTGGLNWAPCDLDFPDYIDDQIKEPLDCATLEVPLDYTNEDSGETLDIQLIRLGAKEEPAEGSIVMIPGGPGNSGVEEIAVKGSIYRDLIGDGYNIIGFDPRGVGRTIPFVCNSTASEDPSSLNARNNYASIVSKDPYEVLTNGGWDYGTAVAEACYATQKDTGNFLGTPFVARDLLAITEAIFDDGLLRFLGRSYSTVLAQTFAAMFPDNVGRIVLDSVFDFEDYLSGRWRSPGRDVEFVLSSLIEACLKTSSPDLCPSFSSDDGTSDQAIEELSDALEEIMDDPELGSLYNPIKFTIVQAQYLPSGMIPTLQLAKATIDRDWEAVQEILEALSPVIPDELWNLGINAFHGIACSDGTFRAEKEEDMFNLVQAQAAQSSFLDSYGPEAWVCAQWKMDAAEHYTGPFHDIQTKNPLLFVSGRYDPSTPLVGAWEAATKFKDSRMVVHEGFGHGVLNHASDCTNKAIREYFREGTLPELGTVCKPNEDIIKVAAAAISGGGNNSTESSD